MESEIAKLKQIRDFCGPRDTLGLPDDIVVQFAARDRSLVTAIDMAVAAHRSLRETDADLLALPEKELCQLVQAHFVNFYPAEAVNPYVAMSAAGPWLVTTHGAVLHDSAGYGMLGLGHAPEALMQAQAQPWVMANVMTPSLSQKRFTDRLQAEIGHTKGACPFSKFVCLNSGSESVTLAARIADINAGKRTAPGGPQAGKKVKLLAVKDGFHGRTDRPAQISHSTMPIYQEHLASFQNRDNLVTVPINDEEALKKAFADADRDGVFFEAFFVEPVMGEGVPGEGLSRSFYDLGRELTAERGTLYVVDSIQAGLRSHGCLSIVDYPGFTDCAPPDMETYSKALNAGQFPLSVVALTDEAAALYIRGVYGNTMTTNPRGLEVGCAVLDAITPELRANVKARGDEFVAKLEALAAEFPGTIDRVVGTGLILCAEMNPERYPVMADDGFERYLRVNGIAMIHGGKNGLRFTPHLAITSEEIDLIVGVIRQGLVALAQAA